MSSQARRIRQSQPEPQALAFVLGGIEGAPESHADLVREDRVVETRTE